MKTGDAASHVNPSGSVNDPDAPLIAGRCDPVPAGETPTTSARARCLWSAGLTGFGPEANSR